MMRTRDLGARFEAYGDWRRRLGSTIAALQEWLIQQELASAQTQARLARLQAGLTEEKLLVAFVAELSRGKSELINAIFFADFGKRLIPSSAGRTTMCPTEILHDASLPPSVRLLPIETRATAATVAEYRDYADEWITLPLDLASADRMGEALGRVAEVKQVPVAVAESYGLYDANTPAAPAPGGDAPLVEIPCWRHAIVNFPHPLLQQGLVVLDTPGLNAIGAEPELTLNLLPSAHAVLFLLAADAGVTRSDLEVWQRHLAGDDPATNAGRFVVLNKIDGLWDELKSEGDIKAEIARQVMGAARTLGVPLARVFAVSAQKALLAKINGDDPLLERSGLPVLEDALSRALIPAKRDLVGIAAQSEIRSVVADVRETLEGRRRGLATQLAELRAVRGKNQDVVTHMMDRVREEKELFERGLQRFTALRTVFTEQTNALYGDIAQVRLRATAVRIQRQIEDSPFTKGIRSAMTHFFEAIRGDFDRAARQATEITTLMEAMYARFADERGAQRAVPLQFSMLKYHKEIDRLEAAYNAHFNTLWNMLSTAKLALMRRFFDTIASRVKRVYDVANRAVEGWLHAVMAPLESQVKEHHAQLRRRLDSIKRIHRASGEYEERVAELELADVALVKEISALEARQAAIDEIILQPDIAPRAANA